MGKLKDILYDISDILSAISIVGIASLIIWFSIGNIMEYPSIVSAAQQQNQENPNFGLAVPVGDGVASASAIENNNNTTGSSIKGEVVPYSVYITYGESTTSIAQKFVDIGLFESVEQFNTLLTQMNAASAIKSGTFIILSDATPEEVITKITTTSGQ